MSKLNSIGVELLRRLGFIGSTDPLSSIIPRVDSPMGQDELDRDMEAAAKLANPDSYNKYTTRMQRPETMDQTLDLWEEMATWDLMAAALVELAEETVQRDASDPGTIWFECNDSEFEEELNNMAALIGTEDKAQSQAWGAAALGNHFEKVNYAVGDGVTGLTYVHPKRVKRYWLERSGQCVGFKWLDQQPRKDDLFVAADGATPIPRAAIAISQGNVEDLWYPWDFLHFRRMFRLRSSEYGEAIYDEAQGIYKKLRMAIDQMTVHRAQIQPDRYVVNIDVQDQAPMDQMRTVQRWKQMLRSRQSFGAAGTSEGSFNTPQSFQSFYNPWALDSVIWMAKPRGFEHSIDKLQGTANVPDVYDIELLTDLFYSIIGMPKSWFGIGESGGQNAPSGKSLLAQDIRFLRKVRSLRKPIINQYTWLGNFHAILKGRSDLDSLNIQAKMSDIGGLEDMMKMELLNLQADILGKLGQVMLDFNLPKEAWIELIFKRYLHLPSEVVDVFMTALPAPVEQPAMESSDARARISMAKEPHKVILEHVDRVLRGDKHSLKVKFSAILDSKRINEPAPKFTSKTTISMPKFTEHERIREEDHVYIQEGKSKSFTSIKQAVNESSTSPNTVPGRQYITK